ncbi:MAG: hypothetical protein PUA61_08315 [Succinatimonas hippei]|nr:hypothetical protein [Succinatimonas hippei]
MAETKTAFHSLLADLRKAGVMEDEYHWAGLVLGLLCRGYDPSDREISKLASELLNGQSPLPGALVAKLTSMSFEFNENLSHASDELIPLPDQNEKAELRLKTLAELSYGLTLGLCCTPGKGMSYHLPQGSLTDFVDTLSEFVKVDTSGDLDEQDYNAILAYIREHLLEIYKKSKL